MALGLFRFGDEMMLKAILILVGCSSVVPSIDHIQFSNLEICEKFNIQMQQHYFVWGPNVLNSPESLRSYQFTKKHTEYKAFIGVCIEVPE
ncbi:MAG: hypothetical protein ABIP54_02070 [Candidatus Andersenbacteria bacterium]